MTPAHNREHLSPHEEDTMTDDDLAALIAKAEKGELHVHYPSVILALARELLDARKALAAVRYEVGQQPYRHRDAPCTDSCVDRVCADVLKALALANPEATR